MQTLELIFTVNEFTWTMVFILAVMGTSFVSGVIGSTFLGVVYFPGFVVACLTSIYFCKQNAVTFTADREVDTVVLGCLGLLVAIVVQLVLTRIVVAVHAWTIPAPELTRQTRVGAPHVG